MIPNKQKKFHYMEVKTGEKDRKTEKITRFFIYSSNFCS